jgi:hypothetical protein
VWDTLIAVAEGEAYTVDLRTSRGDVVVQLRVPIVRRPIPAAIRDSIIASELQRATAGAAAEGGRSLAQLQELIRVQHFADSLPPYAGLYTSRDGLLWVLDPIGPMDSIWTATAFQRDYTIAARIRGPGRRAPVAFGVDRVILAHVDESGFEIWRAYALIR